MTPFEFVFFLYAIMLTLALAHLVGGWAMNLRNADAIRWSAPYVMWAVAALLMTTGNLTSFWQMRGAPAWSAWLVLSNFLFAIVNYVWCVFITPEVERGGTLDLAAFHAEERKRYLGAAATLEAIAIASNVANGFYAGYGHWMQDLAGSMVMLMMTLAAIIWNSRIVQVGASASVLLIGVYAVITSSSVLP
jgi:hypothetical protein